MFKILHAIISTIFLSVLLFLMSPFYITIAFFESKGSSKKFKFAMKQLVAPIAKLYKN